MRWKKNEMIFFERKKKSYGKWIFAAFLGVLFVFGLALNAFLGSDPQDYSGTDIYAGSSELYEADGSSGRSGKNGSDGGSGSGAGNDIYDSESKDIPIFEYNASGGIERGGETDENGIYSADGGQNRSEETTGSAEMSDGRTDSGDGADSVGGRKASGDGADSAGSRTGLNSGSAAGSGKTDYSGSTGAYGGKSSINNGSSGKTGNGSSDSGSINTQPGGSEETGFTGFMLRDIEGEVFVLVYQNGSIDSSYKTAVDPEMLPEYDRRLLKKGISVRSGSELEELMQDYEG